jgi:hypothetical protein
MRHDVKVVGGIHTGKMAVVWVDTFGGQVVRVKAPLVESRRTNPNKHVRQYILEAVPTATVVTAPCQLVIRIERRTLHLNVDIGILDWDTNRLRPNANRFGRQERLSHDKAITVSAEPSNTTGLFRQPT